MTGYRFVVSGVVQGVGFRWFVARHARALGLRGFARNLPDGSVEVEVSGPAESIPALEERLRAGPANAAVERVDRSEKEVEAWKHKSFDIM